MDLHPEWRIALAALYLPGLGQFINVNRRRWPAVLSALRSSGASLCHCADALRSAGLSEEALIVAEHRILVAAETALTEGRGLTLLDDGYPQAWIEKLKETAPPALWQRGRCSRETRVAVVGSRDVPPESQQFAAEAARTLVELGCAVVTGGAAGCDAAARRATLDAGGAVVTILPYGIDYCPELAPSDWILSCAAPGERFSVARAMERNALIYASSEAAVVAHSKLKAGGTWHGSVDALRRKLCPVFVRQVHDEPGNRALSQLGAKSIDNPSVLPELLAARATSPPGYFALRAG